MTFSPFRIPGKQLSHKEAKQMPMTSCPLAGGPLSAESISNRFKNYLMAIEMLVIDLPDIIEQFENELGDNHPTVNRLNKMLSRIYETL